MSSTKHQYIYSPIPNQQSTFYDPNQVQFSHFPYDESAQGNPPNCPQSIRPAYFTPSAPVKGNLGGNFSIDDEPPLLEELGVNFSHIFEKTQNVLNPMRECPLEVLEDTDLAGPLVFCLVFGGTLLMAGKVHFNYIYGLGVLGCLGIYILLSLMTVDGVSSTCVASVLGYCMLPMCILSACSVFFPLTNLGGIILTTLIVFWCAMSSSKLFVRALNMQHQQFLVGYPCALVYAVFALLTVF